MFINLTGKKFNDLVVIGFHGVVNGRTLWLCECKCGNRIPVEAYNLKNSHTTSCGCHKQEQLKERTDTQWCRTPEYKVWSGMKRRCNNPNSKSYKDYGSRGIKLCAKWDDPPYGFLEFYKDMGKRPSEKHEIERINNEGNYESGNCKWVLRAENAKNKRNNINITYKGQTMILADWSKVSGIKRATLYFRYHKGLRGEELFK